VACEITAISFIDPKTVIEYAADASPPVVMIEY
jgi:hypothetical protein